MAETIHYYKTISGKAHFAETGVVKSEDRLGQYLRMLRFAKKVPVCLHLDNPDDFKIIRELFKIQDNIKWQDIYYEK